MHQQYFFFRIFKTFYLRQAQIPTQMVASCLHVLLEESPGALLKSLSKPSSLPNNHLTQPLMRILFSKKSLNDLIQLWLVFCA